MRLKREAFAIVQSERRRIGDQAGLEEKFKMALQLLWMAYQPIVSLNERRVFGYEALVRCNEPSFHTPTSLLEAAEQLEQLHDLGRAIRNKVACDAEQCPDGIKLFVNLHALDLNDRTLFAPDGMACPNRDARRFGDHRARLSRRRKTSRFEGQRSASDGISDRHRRSRCRLRRAFELLTARA